LTNRLSIAKDRGLTRTTQQPTSIRFCFRGMFPTATTTIFFANSPISVGPELTVYNSRLSNLYLLLTLHWWKSRFLLRPLSSAFSQLRYTRDAITEHGYDIPDTFATHKTQAMIAYPRYGDPSCERRRVSIGHSGLETVSPNLGWIRNSSTTRNSNRDWKLNVSHLGPR
jgi:hypothetical protein